MGLVASSSRLHSDWTYSLVAVGLVVGPVGLAVELVAPVVEHAVAPLELRRDAPS